MGNKPRRWIKLYCYETLHGSVSYQLTAEERDVWTNLLCLAGLCANDGVIADHDLRPFPEHHIIKATNTTVEIYRSCLEKCKAEGRIQQNGQGILIITNWKKYQPEYDRQKQYRGRGSHLDEDPETRQKRLLESNEKVMAAWEAAHPGQTHPARARPDEIDDEGGGE